MRLLPAFSMLAALGCGSPADTVPHIDFVSDEYRLMPGEERYYCYTMTLPADQDIAVTRMAPTYGDGTHHILFSQVIAAEPPGFSECNVLNRNTWVPLYAGGRESGPLEMPAGSGLKMLFPSQQLIMQLHLQNASSRPIAARTTMRIEYTSSPSTTAPAGIFGYDNRALSIPARAAAAVNTMSCRMDKPLEKVFAVLGHMHKSGVHLQLSRGAQAGDEVLFDTDWNFDQQPVTPVALKVAKGDQIFLRCTHKNRGDAPLLYGESSDTEMCAAVFYYTPYDVIDGCINQP